MLDHCARNIEASLTHQPEPEREIDIFKIAEEVFVEAADPQKNIPAKQRRSGAGRKNLSGGPLDSRRHPPMIPAPGKTAGMINVSRPIQFIRRSMPFHVTSEKSVARILLSRLRRSAHRTKEEDSPGFKDQLQSNKVILSERTPGCHLPFNLFDLFSRVRGYDLQSLYQTPILA